MKRQQSITVVLGVLLACLLVSISTVESLEITATVEPSTFSPDADGHEDVMTLSYSLSTAAQVTINILDSNGRIVRSLSAAGEALTANPRDAETVYQVNWDGKDYRGSDLPDGVYSYWINANQAVDDNPNFELTQHGDGATNIRTPRYLRVDDQGNLYIADLWSAATRGGMSKFLPDGTPLWYFAPPSDDGWATTVPGQVRFVKDFAFDDQGRVYWADTTDDEWSRVNVWNLGSEGLTYAGFTFGRGGNTESSGTDIVMDALSFIEYYQGALYLGDAQNDRVQKVQFDGIDTFTHVWTSYATEGFGSPYLLRGLRDTHAIRVAPNPVIDPANPEMPYLYVSDPGEQEHHTPSAGPRSSSVAVLDLETGRVLKRYPDPDNPIPGTQGLFSDQVIKGLAVDEIGESFYVAEYKRGTGAAHTYRVLKISSDGQLLMRIYGANGLNFRRPYSVALDSQTDPITGMKRLYVSDQDNNRVVRLVLAQAQQTGQITLKRTGRIVLRHPGNEGGLTVSANAAGGLRGRQVVRKMAAGTPTTTALFGNYPNPFNASTTIDYGLADDAYVTLRIFNMAGARVRTLVHMHQAAGFYAASWDGLDDQGRSVATGVYFGSLTTDSQAVRTGKLLLLR